MKSKNNQASISTCRGVKCELHNDQFLLLLSTFGSLIFILNEHRFVEHVYMFNFKLITVLFLIFTVVITFYNKQLKALLIGKTENIPFYAAPVLFLILYMAKDGSIHHLLYYVIQYAILGFLIRSRKVLKHYIFLNTALMIVLMILLPMKNNDLIVYGITFIAISAVIWNVGTTFAMIYKRLNGELNRVLELNYLNSHQVRARVARVKGLRQLMANNLLEDESLLDKEIEAIDDEIKKFQEVISNDKGLEKMAIAPNEVPQTKWITPISASLIIFFIIGLIHVALL